MSPKRATAYVGLASVLVAWLAGAGGLSDPPPAPQPVPPVQDISGTQALADELQAQTARLHERLSVSPLPRTPSRNPFLFVARTAPAPRVVVRSRPEGTLSEAPPAEPPLLLIGIAERQTAAGRVRTAVMTADSDELLMLGEGETLGGRYRVTTVGADAVELADLVTGGIRRLILR